MDKEKNAKKSSKKKNAVVAEQLYSTPSESVQSDDDSESSDDENGFDVNLDGNDDHNSANEDWSTDDDRLLVEKIKATVKENDHVNFKTRLKQVDWKQIAFKKYSAKDCEDRFNAHLKRVRRYRNLKEIVVDIEINIKKAREGEGLSAYHVFVQEQLSKATTSADFENLTERFKELSPKEKLVYELKAKQLNLSKNKNKNKASTPPPTKIKTPFQLYAESQKSESDHANIRQEYNNMSVDQKYDWIVKAVRQAPESITKILNKEEQRIFKGQINSAPTAYTLYVKDMYDKIKAKTDKKPEIFSQIAQLWKQLDANKKKKYADAAAAMKKVATKEQDEFKERHGLVATKRRKSTYVEHPTGLHSDDGDDDDRGKSPKKRKVSISNASESSSGLPATKQITLQPKSSIKSSAKSNLSLVIDEVASKNVDETIEKKKKKKKSSNSISESNDLNENVTSPKKKSKKEKKEKNIEPPGEKPPPSEFEYFAKHIHTGKPKKAQKAFNKLTEEERQSLTTEYKQKVSDYMAHLKKYLETLSKEDAIAYIKKAKEAEQKGNNSQEN